MIKQGSFNKLSALLNDNNHVLIPDLQRDYCWGDVIPEGQKVSLAYNFTEELIKLCKATKTQERNEISYGIIYTYEYPETFYYLCDGQQRLTTLYLIIGVLNTYLNDSKLNSLLMLNNQQPRLKYEIRNSTDYFIKHLINQFSENTLKSNFADITKASWYRKEYEDDPSVKSIVAAVKDIHALFKKEDNQAIADFIYNKIGFVYLNLKGNENLENHTYSKIREYGEKMYEIVNTSGDPMEANEHIKSLLLSNVSDSEKEVWTEKWEIWQDFFWIHKSKDDESADEGFNEFLSWIKMLKGKNKEIDSVEEVEKYFKALFLLFFIQPKLSSLRKYKIVDLIESLHKKSSSKLVTILPALLYLKNTNSVIFDGSKYVVNIDSVDINALFRFLRFFSNISMYTEASSFATLLDDKLLQGDDITKLLNYSKMFSSILSNEEGFKLKLYEQADEKSRIELENIFWKAEDHEYMNGKIESVFKWMKIDLSGELISEFDAKRFVTLYKTFLSIIDDAYIDKTRINLLAICNNWSKFHEGWSWGVARYYLGIKSDTKYWQKMINSSEFSILMKKSIKGQLDEDFLNESILKNENVEHRKTYRKLKAEASKHWQWNNNYRFFIKDNILYIPNGVQAKGNTTEIKL
jgi:hypothetical protein